LDCSSLQITLGATSPGLTEMAKVIDSSKLTPSNMGSEQEKYWIYNGLDCAVTHEVSLALDAVMHSNERPRTDAQLLYAFERAMQAPALDLMLRGWRVDLFRRDEAVALLRKQEVRVQDLLDRFATAVWKRGLNPNSPIQLKAFFYGAMRIPEQHKFEKGVKKVSTNRESLEKIGNYFHARPLVSCILALRDIKKKISVLTTEIDQDKRLRTSYNVAGTETGRWSSSTSAFGTGTNLQNINEELRRVFIADEGWKLGYLDLEQAESRALAFCIWSQFGDDSYLNACESGDLHTYCCRLIWPKLAWTGDISQDKAIAETIFYRHFTYRDMSKRGGHATNYYGKPPTIARHLHITTAMVREFQAAYFEPFPGIQRYHRWVAQELQLRQYLQTPLGMGRHFFGRPEDDSTLREAIAFVPQSMVGQLLNLALWRVWHHEKRVQLLGQVHDAIVLQYPDDPSQEGDILENCMRLMETSLSARGRTLIIPVEAKVGWNWQDPKKLRVKVDNPDGLQKWRGSDQRQRQERPSSSRLDHRLS
jgi:DNA polymerase-1